ncbi:MAG: hypothetical protein AAB533_03815 [Patescibacteria group bacterium]
MQPPAIVKQTKDYLLVKKIPLPRGAGDRLPTDKHENGGMTMAEKRLWGIIQDGEREYRAGKTIRARFIDEALKIHARKKN